MIVVCPNRFSLVSYSQRDLAMVLKDDGEIRYHWISSVWKFQKMPGICCHRIESRGKIVLIRALRSSYRIKVISHQQLVLQGHACLNVAVVGPFGKFDKTFSFLWCLPIIASFYHFFFWHLSKWDTVIVVQEFSCYRWTAQGSRFKVCVCVCVCVYVCMYVCMYICM